MPRYQIHEMDGGEPSASHLASGTTALEALQKITGKTIWTPALQSRWFRVVDEDEGDVIEYIVEHEFTSRREFCASPFGRQACVLPQWRRRKPGPPMKAAALAAGRSLPHAPRVRWQ